MSVLIHNVKGSSKISQKAPYPYGSWLQYWEGVSGNRIMLNTRYNCPGCGAPTTREHFDGCHLQKVGLVDRKWYLMPLCDKCNQRTDMFSVDEKLLEPVPSNL